MRDLKIALGVCCMLLGAMSMDSANLLYPLSFMLMAYVFLRSVKRSEKQ